MEAHFSDLKSETKQPKEIPLANEQPGWNPTSRGEKRGLIQTKKPNQRVELI